MLDSSDTASAVALGFIDLNSSQIKENGPFGLTFPLRLQLLADRQCADALAGRGEDRVDQCRRKRRHARLADAAGRRVGAGRYDVDVRDGRGLIDPDYREIVEITLLHLAVLEGDRTMFDEAHAHDRGALDLRLDPLRIDVGSAIYGGIDPRHGELALVVNGHLDDGRDIADEAAVRGNAEPVTLGDGPAPAALVRDQLDDLAKTRGIDRIAVIGLAVVPEVFHRIELDDPGRADQLQQHILLIAFGGKGDFSDHRLHREGARDVRYGAEPADAGMRGRFRILALNVGDLEGHVDKPHAEFERGLMHRIGGKCRGDARRDAAMPPGRHLAVLVEAGLDAFHRDGVQEAVVNVVVPRPLHLYGS